MKKQEIDIVKEGTTKCFVFKNKDSSKGPGSKEGKPFYNPSMELNRDLSIVVNQWFINKCKKPVRLLDGLAATGIRGLRFANEINGEFDVTINDWNEQAFFLIKKNLELNKLEKVIASNKNLNVLLSEKKYDYIDIDPFGSPAPFIDSAVRSVYNNGIIACTSTDTATLCGIYPNVCFRRYGARPFHSFVMHETGLRVLLGFICREASKHDKSMEPIISYSTDHYFRVYVRIRNGKRYANESMENFSVISPKEFFPSNKEQDIGPLWRGKLHNKTTVKEIRTLLFKKKLNTKNSLWKLLSIFEEEANAPPFFYTTDNFASRLKMATPKMNKIFEKLKSKGYSVVRTHFSPTGFKTNASLGEITKVFKEDVV
ncbi:MAG: tRNA (guanine(10)-N(2))-dimethyltransferase [Thermoplasmatales archaeon]|nr:MAG: tRNA (guanine(10)-N(2))-dimethyltransferase [Thermoplasmatales archaeon]